MAGSRGCHYNDISPSDPHFYKTPGEGCLTVFYTTYEDSVSANQNGRKLEVLDRRCDGTHSILG